MHVLRTPLLSGGVIEPHLIEPHVFGIKEARRAWGNVDAGGREPTPFAPAGTVSAQCAGSQTNQIQVI